MTVVSVSSGIDETQAVLLAQYAQFVGACECAFWGVRNDKDNCYGKDTGIWTFHERWLVQRYLAEAQSEIEDVLGYPVGNRWFTETHVMHPARYVHTVVTRQARLIELGTKRLTLLADDVPLDYNTDPAIAIVPYSPEVSEDSIVVCHQGTKITIVPSDIYISSAFFVIEIPRCRLVVAEYQNNPPDGLDYDDDTFFAGSVDVYACSTDTSKRATMLCIGACGQRTEDVTRIWIQNGQMGIVQFVSLSCCDRGQLTLNYRAGSAPSLQEQDAIIRLAHSKMPDPPCSYGGQITELWKRDRNIPEILTRERLNCQFGISDGAWIAWQFAQAMRQARACNL